MNSRSSYSQVLRSSSIIGGANGLNYLVALVRVKIIAVLLGPAGVGLVSLYMSTIGLVGTVSGLGIASSGVREVALAFSQQDPIAAARTVRILRRACWATGLLGWTLAAALAPLLSSWITGTTEHAVAIAVLGVTLVLGAVNGGQTALLQGVRRIGDIARASVAAMLLNTGVAIGLYAWLGQRGIVPVLVTTAAVSLGVSWWFARRVHVEPVALSWPDTFAGTRRFAGLGLAFMWSGLLTAGLDMSTRILITREFGIDVAGLYQAAWAISGLFASFILSAMGTDFYPRLTSVIHDHELATNAVNEQTEIGMLLALPGLLGTLAFAPWIMEIFYTKQFVAGAALLPWFVLGIFGRVMSWPLGFIQLAKGASRWFVATETVFVGFQLAMLLWTLPRFGLVGVAYTFAITYFVHTFAMLWVAKALIGFRWSAGVKKLLVMSGTFVLIGLGVRLAIPGWTGMLIGGVVTLSGAILSLRGLAARLGANSRLCKLVCVVPGGRWIMGD
jgi:PST family polysaccharide transporter